jgi:putative copper export protein
MRFVLHVLTLLGWAVWFGGILAVFLIATMMFQRFERQRAGETNVEIFRTFERAQIGVAALTLGAATVQYLRHKTTPRAWVIILISAAVAGVILAVLYVSPQMHALRDQGMSESPAWRKLHGMSMGLYAFQAVILLIAGLVLPWSFNDPVGRQGVGDRSGSGS